MKYPRRHPVTLEFASEDLESDFQSDYARKSVRQVRYAMLLGVLLYGFVFGFLDLVSAPASYVRVVWAVRGGVGLAALGVFALTFIPSFRAWMQPAVGALMLAGGLGLVLMLALDPTGQNYYDGPVLILLATFVVVRLRFIYASIVALTTVAAYTAVAAGLKTTTFVDPISNTVMIAATALIGMFAGYMLEDYARREFWQTKIINEKRKENARLLQSRSRFFANVSHEFRTPLTLILGPLEDWTEDAPAPVPDGLQTAMRRMKRNASRLLALVNQLLDLARLEVGEWTLHPETASLVAFTRDAVRAFHDQARRAGVDLQYDAPSDDAPDAVASFDPDALETVIVNLVGNALKFTPEGGTVRVSVTTSDDAVHIRVRDTGPGIPDDDLPHVFDRFHQSDDSTLRRHDGTGIGLALAQELVRLHDGSIEVESEVGFGSTFTVTLPRTPTSSVETSSVETSSVEARASDTAPTRSRSSLQGVPAVEDVEAIEVDTNSEDRVHEVDHDESDAEAPLVLLVEDDPDVRAYVRDGLGASYRIEEAGNGEDGLAAARDTVPDLIVADVMMPGMDGMAFCQAVKSDDALDHVPVLMLTARVERVVEGLDAGADAYVGKPFTLRELRARIRNLLANRQRVRDRFAAERLARPSTAEPSTVDVDSADERFVQRAREAVEDHLDDEHFNVDAFAEAVGLSPRQLQRKLKSITGHTPSAFIRLIRLRRGAQLVAQDYGTVSEIAYAVGFNSPSYFTKCFRETFGAPPTEYDGSEREE